MAHRAALWACQENLVNIKSLIILALFLLVAYWAYKKYGAKVGSKV
jgi:hypothetical protein